MKVTPELLQKYVSGKCSLEEQRLVERWMPGEEDIPPSAGDEKLELEIRQMWQNISTTTTHYTKVVSLKNRITRYAAAACLLVFATCALTFIYRHTTDSPQAAFDNRFSGSSYRIQTAQLDITLLPGSQVLSTGNPDDTDTVLSVCGNLILENKQPRQVTLAYTTSCKLLPDNDIRNIRQLKAGKTYVLIEHNGISGAKHLLVEKRFARLVLADLFPREKYKMIIEGIFV